MRPTTSRKARGSGPGRRQVREVASCQHACKLDDEALRAAFGLSTSELAAFRSNPAWAEQIQYLMMLEATSPLRLETLYVGPADHDAVFRAAQRVADSYKEQLLRWYWDRILSRIELRGRGDGPLAKLINRSPSKSVQRHASKGNLSDQCS
jgi:hypothetical protein